jgi:hypothetical protein
MFLATFSVVQRDLWVKMKEDERGREGETQYTDKYSNSCTRKIVFPDSVHPSYAHNCSVVVVPKPPQLTWVNRGPILRPHQGLPSHCHQRWDPGICIFTKLLAKRLCLAHLRTSLQNPALARTLPSQLARSSLSPNPQYLFTLDIWSVSSSSSILQVMVWSLWPVTSKNPARSVWSENPFPSFIRDVSSP